MYTWCTKRLFQACNPHGDEATDQVTCICPFVEKSNTLHK